MQGVLRCFRALTRVDQIENGRFQQAAKMYKEVAEIAEADGVVDEALKNYKLAAEYYAQVIAVVYVLRLTLPPSWFAESFGAGGADIHGQPDVPESRCHLSDA